MIYKDRILQTKGPSFREQTAICAKAVKHKWSIKKEVIEIRAERLWIF